jgi:uncharacterized protein (TIGR02453 family)
MFAPKNDAMQKLVLDFLAQLAENNNREWFRENKKRYEDAKEDVESFVDSIIPALAKFDDAVKYVEAKDCMFRIFRDVRFARDKSPYKTNMGAWITRSGRKSSGPGYYIHLEPGESFLAAGVYMPEPDQLKKIRNEIYHNIEEFKAILNDKNLTRIKAGLHENDKGKMAPRDFPKDFPDIELLKFKHYTLTSHFEDEMVCADHFFDNVLMAFRAMVPLNSFLKRALEV